MSASEFETLGNTVLEAYSSGIPVVVPRTQVFFICSYNGIFLFYLKGFKDTVCDTVDGYLFEPKNVNQARRF